MLLQTFLEESAQSFPLKTALIAGDRRCTYAEIDSQCNQLSHSLLCNGLERGDRVAIYMDNSIEAVVAIFAALKAGGVFLVINASTKVEKVAYVLNDCRAAALVTTQHMLGSVEQCLQQTPHLRMVVLADGGERTEAESAEKIFLSYADGRSQPATRPQSLTIDIDLAALVYTSGSTGRPKGVMLTHLNMVSAATSITTYLENRRDDVIINLLPLAFDYGLYQVLMAFKMGATLVLERGVVYPYKLLELLLKERVTGLPLVPTISSILLRFDLSQYRFPDLRYITNTAAALPTEHIRRLRSMLPHVKIYSMYGLTECKRVSYLPPDQIDLRPGSVGKGMPNEEVYIVDELGRRLGPGEVGELVVRGANVMKGYWELPEETSRVLRDGGFNWPEEVLYTGDLFKTDEEGYLYWVGRRDDIIKTRGEKVSPREVEDVIYSLEGVVDAAVIGVPDSVLGSAIKATVVIAEGSSLTEQEILQRCKRCLEDFMIPKYIEFRDSMPKTATGKISKRSLAADSSSSD